MSARALAVVAFFPLLLVQPALASAQTGVAVEGRTGVTFPVGELSDAGVEAGMTLEAELQLYFHPNFAGYLSLRRHSFSCEDECPLGEDPRSSGGAAGLKVVVPSPADAILWIRGGVIAHDYSHATASGDRNIGFEGGAGIDMLITEDIYLVPHVGYLAHEGFQDIDVSYLTFGVGVQYRLR